MYNYIFQTASHSSIRFSLWHSTNEDHVKERGEGLAEAEDEAECGFELGNQAEKEEKNNTMSILSEGNVT